MAGVCAALVILDARFFAIGTYRAPIFDAELYHQLSQYLLVMWADTVPGLAAWVGTMAPSIPVDRAADLDRDVVVHFLAGKGLGYPAFLALAQLVLGEGFERIRLAQALLHGASAALVFALGSRVGGRAVGWVALALFAAYLPFTYMASQVMAESLCAFLILLTAYLALRLLAGGPDWLAPLLGLALIWLGVSRPVYFSLSLVLLAVVAVGMAWRWRSRSGPAVALAVALLLAGYMGPYLGWQVQVSRAEAGEAFVWSPSGVRSIGPSLVESYDVTNDGWVAPAAFLGTKGRTLAPVPVADSLSAHPLESVLLRVEKFYRLWKAPATSYTNPYLLGHGFTDVLHGVLLLGGLIGMAVAVRSLPGALLLLPILFTAAAYTGYFSEERRFVFPVMGVMVVFCAAAIHWVRSEIHAAGFRAYGLRPERRTVAACVVAAALGALLVADGFVVQPWMPPAFGHGVAVAVFAAAAIWLACRLSAKIAETGPLRWWALVLMWGALVLPVTVHVARYHDWTTWGVTLDRSGEAVSQRFELPEGLDWEQVAVARAQVDVLDGDGRIDGLSVTLNDQPLTRVIGVDRMPSALRFAAEQLYPLRRDMDWRSVAVVPGMRQWLSFAVDPTALGKAREVTLAMIVTEATGAPTRVFGDLPVGDGHVSPGPRPWLDRALYKRLNQPMGYSGRNSLWRYQTDGDMRLYGGTVLSGGAQSGYVAGEGAAVRRDDLSDAALTQSGGYRIRLQLITRDGRELIL